MQKNKDEIDTFDFKKINEFIDNSLKKNKALQKEDLTMLNEILGDDKDFVLKLKQYYYNPYKISVIFNKIQDLKKCIFETELYTFRKPISKLEKGIYGIWNFTPIYQNLNNVFFHKNVRIEMTRQENKIFDKELINDLKLLQISNFKIVDIEFFEFLDWDKQSDLSRKIKIITKTDITFKELREFIKSEKLHIEKEKIHYKFIVGKRSKEYVILPIYIGYGTNQPYGYGQKTNSSKKRWFKLDFEHKQSSFIEKGKLKSVKGNLKDRFENHNSEISLTAIIETWNKKRSSIVYSVVNKKPEKYKEPNNDVLIGFAELKVEFNKQKDFHPVDFISEIKPHYIKEKKDRVKVWRKILTTGYQSYLKEIIDTASEKYAGFLSVEFSPYYMISKLGTIKVFNIIKEKYQKILDDNDFNALWVCANFGEIEVVAGDLYTLGMDTEQNKFTNLLLYSIINDKIFNDMIINNK